jgi:shikimate kinase
MAGRVILIGYRGTGKSTVGRLVASRLGWDFADADEYLESAAGRSIAEVFASEGEAGFRDRESAVLSQLCGRDRLVIATGGGAVLRPANRTLLRSAGFVAWLTASPAVLWDRLRADPASGRRRPNLTPAGGLDEVRTLLAARTPLYAALADFVCDTETLSPHAAADAILTAWRTWRTGSHCRSCSGAAGPSSSA